MKKLKLFSKRFLIVFIAILSFTLARNVKVSAGYMYSSDGNLIYSSDGYKVTTDGIYTILSTAWSGLLTDADANNSATSFNSPSDMALFTDENTGVETIYIVDSESNKLFTFDSSLRYLDTYNRFEINPDNFTTEELERIYTNSVDGNTVSESRGSSQLFWTSARQTTYDGCKNIPFERRADNQRFYITCLGLSGVYRSLRPLRDADGKILLDEDGKTLYQDVIYLCDTTNRQVLLLDSNSYEVIQVVSAPTGYDFSDKFQPTKIVTDSTGRMFIISINIYEGILLMSYQGNFMRMVGVNYSTLSLWDALRRNFRTEEQLAQETTILQTSFNNLCIDSSGFLYTISGPVTNPDGTVNNQAMIKRINQSNTDVLKRNGYSVPVGDLIYARVGSNAGSSNFVSITVNEYGVYTVADSRNKRLFTYDNEGNLLYISGGGGLQVTDIQNPVAIAYQGDSLLVLDKGSKCVMRYEPTDFANKINRATYYEFIGDAISAADQWQDVINSNPQYELAYVGVGKKLYEEGRYQEAMLNFEKGSDVRYYSRAYKMYRDNIIKEYFPGIITGLLVLLVGVAVYKGVKKGKKKKPSGDGELL